MASFSDIFADDCDEDKQGCAFVARIWKFFRSPETSDVLTPDQTSQQLIEEINEIQSDFSAMSARVRLMREKLSGSPRSNKQLAVGSMQFDLEFRLWREQLLARHQPNQHQQLVEAVVAMQRDFRILTNDLGKLTFA